MSKEILTYEEFLYIENDDEIEVVGYTGSEDPVEIPEYINDKPVTSLGYCDFFYFITKPKRIFFDNFNFFRNSNFLFPPIEAAYKSGFIF